MNFMQHRTVTQSHSKQASKQASKQRKFIPVARRKSGTLFI
jgi:hypothetical protein